ncbi:MAG: putative Ig domain-containing protein [Planctomycetes bacterium]|nr:putative Ig domain-containing protein [Planctomycetota bacterium]
MNRKLLIILVFGAVIHLFNACDSAPKPPVITSSSPIQNAIEGINYNFSFQAEKGKLPYIWFFTNFLPVQPSGLNFTHDGTIFGTPAVGSNGVYTFDVEVVDSTGSEGERDSRQFTLTIEEHLEITSTSPLTNAVEEIAYYFTFQAGNGVGPYLWKFTNFSPSQPLGMNFADNGEINGTPSAGASGTYTFDVTLTDSGYIIQEYKDTYELTIDKALEITALSPIPDISEGSTSNFVFQAQYGAAPYTWQYSIFTPTQPAGLNFNPDGTITGSPDIGSNGTYTFDVTVTDSGAPQQDTENFSLTITLGFIYQWTKTVKGSGDIRANSVVTDSQDNIIVSGGFHGTVDFDPGTGTHNISASGSEWEQYVLKLDSSGDFLWVYASRNSGRDYFYDAVVDSNNDVYACGYTHSGYKDPHLAKIYGSTGSLIWGKTVYSTGMWGEFALGVTYDSTGNAIYVVGSYDDGRYSFCCKYSPAGISLWAKRLSITNHRWSYTDSRAYDVLVDNGQVYLSGYFGYPSKNYVTTVDFDPGAGTSTVSSNTRAAFLVALNSSNGAFVWVATWGEDTVHNPNKIVSGTSLAVDSNNNVYVAGAFRGTIDFDPSAGIHNKTASSANENDAYLLCLNNSGVFQWVKTIGSSGHDSASGVTIDTSDNIYITGYITGTTDLDPGSGTDNHISNGSNDCYVLKLNDSGDFVKANSWGGTESDTTSKIHINESASKFFITGIFQKTVDFNPDPLLTDNKTSGGSYDGFITCYIK